MIRASNNPFECTPVLITTGGSGFSKTLQWDGSSTITVPVGFSGTILNYNNGELVTYTVSGTNLTITGSAENGNILILTQL
jgi:hypothetical protein